MPLLSIIVPIYNVENYLAKCIESILAQTFQDFELLLINDGSTDNSEEICVFYKEVDKRILVLNKTNGGVSSARNVGLCKAKGKYIAFVDPDDTIEPNMYEVLLHSAVTNNLDLVVCPIKTINSKNEVTSTSRVWREVNCVLDKNTIVNNIIPEILKGKNYSLISCVNKVYRRSLFTSVDLKFNEEKTHSEDARLNLSIIKLVENLFFVDKPLYNYYRHERDSLTQKFRYNLYEYILDNKEFMIQLCREFNQDSTIDSVRHHYTTVTLSYIEEVVRANIIREDKISIVTSIIQDKEFFKEISQYKSNTKYFTFLKYFSLLQNGLLIYTVVTNKVKLQAMISRLRVLAL